MSDTYIIKKISECDIHTREIVKKLYDGHASIFVILNKDITNQTIVMSYTHGIFPFQKYLTLHHHVINSKANTYTVANETIKILNFLLMKYPSKNILSRHTIDNYKSMFMLKRLGFSTITRNIEDVPNIAIGYHDKKIVIGRSKSNPKNLNYANSFHMDCLLKWAGVDALPINEKAESITIFNNIKKSSIFWVQEDKRVKIMIYDDLRDEALVILYNLHKGDIDECYAAIKQLKCGRILTFSNGENFEDFLFLCGYVKEGGIKHKNEEELLKFKKIF
tara:strand:+ start:4199 stop:5029 length:831 start_codon:yes stop_codon:yes gene_type:complete